MNRNVKYWFIGVLSGLAFIVAGIAYATTYNLPPDIQRGDLIVATSTTQAVRLATSTKGSVLWINSGGVPAWTATSTLGISGGSGSSATTTINGLSAVNYTFSAGSGISISTSAPGTVTFLNTAAGGGATTTIQTGAAGTTISGPAFIFATSSATGLNLNVTGSGSTITFTPQLQAGYNIPLTASSTNWNNFFNTPSTQITAGNGLSWSGNTLNGSMASSTLITGGSTATFSPSVTIATSSDTNILLSVLCATSTCTFTPSWTGTLAAGRLNSNVVQGVSTTTSGNLFNASIAAQSLALTLPINLVNNVSAVTSGTTFSVSTSTTGSTNALVINYPANNLSTTTAASTYPTFTYASSTFVTAVTASGNLSSSGGLQPAITITNNPSFSGTLSVTGTSTLATTTITQLSFGSFTSISNLSAAFGALDTSLSGCVQANSTGVISNTNNPCIIGTGANTQVPYFTGAQSQSGSNNFEWLNTASTLQITGSTTISNLLTVGKLTNSGSETIAGTLGVTGTSTLATTTVTQLKLGNGITSTFLAADSNGFVIATTSPSGGGGLTLPTVTYASSTTVGPTSTVPSGFSFAIPANKLATPGNFVTFTFWAIPTNAGDGINVNIANSSTTLFGTQINYPLTVGSGQVNKYILNTCTVWSTGTNQESGTCKSAFDHGNGDYNYYAQATLSTSSIIYVNLVLSPGSTNTMTAFYGSMTPGNW